MAAPAFTVVIGTEAGMVIERRMEFRKSGIRDLRRGSFETRAVITRGVPVMAVRAHG